MVTHGDILAVLDKEPALDDGGFLWHRHKVSEFNAEVVGICCDWLRRCTFNQTFNRRIDSYGLKHSVERHYKAVFGQDQYIAEVDFIIAVIHMGVPYRITPHKHIQIPISTHSIKSFDPIYRQWEAQKYAHCNRKHRASLKHLEPIN